MAQSLLILRHTFRTSMVAAVLLAASLEASAAHRAAASTITKELAERAMTVTADSGSGEIPLDVSLDWNTPHPEITQALILVHGKGRDVDQSFRTAQRAADTAGQREHTVIVAPQFLEEADVATHRLHANALRWHANAWHSGENAMGPAPISSFAVLDAIVARVEQRAIFPNLHRIVIAGHSAGGQLVQRYAAVGHAVQKPAPDIHVRWVVANPSSFLYFDDDRPDAQGTPAPFSDGGCPHFNRWRYGLRAAPDYAEAMDPAAALNHYLSLDIIYLNGTEDNDPHHPDLDTSCGAEAQGPNRWARGDNYHRYLLARAGSALSQKFLNVEGVAHDASRMFHSRCGIAALFDVGACPAPGRP